MKNNNLRNVFLGLSLCLISSCTSHQTVPDESMIPILASHKFQVLDNVSDCRNQLILQENNVDNELDPANIQLLSWNIKKGQDKSWINDLELFAQDKNLVLIQEAVLNSNFTNTFGINKYWSFADGYQSSDKITGVMTFSDSAPLIHCSLQTKEPWLRTNKATNITKYGIANSDQTLVVANIHAINFSLGTKQFEKQINQLREILSAHNGPIIASGDFNTWREKRLNVVEELIADLNLHSVSFKSDHRKKTFGYSLDYIFVRGFTIKNADTIMVDSSDHNPLIAHLSLL